MNITIPKILTTAERQNSIQEPAAQEVAPSKIVSVFSKTLKFKNDETEKAKQNQALMASPHIQREICVFSNKQLTHWQIAEKRLIDFSSKQFESKTFQNQYYYNIKDKEYILTGKTKLGEKIENQISQELFPFLLTILNSNEIQEMISPNFQSRNFTYLDLSLDIMEKMYQISEKNINSFREKNYAVDYQNPHELYIKNLKQIKTANCGELSALYFYLCILKKDPRFENLAAHLCYINNGNHCFIVISPKLGKNDQLKVIDEDTIIVDPWANSITSGDILPWNLAAYALIVEKQAEGFSISHFVPIVAPISGEQTIEILPRPSQG